MFTTGSFRAFLPLGFRLPDGLLFTLAFTAFTLTLALFTFSFTLFTLAFTAFALGSLRCLVCRL